jgi:hypothetical protein
VSAERDRAPLQHACDVANPLLEILHTEIAQLRADLATAEHARQAAELAVDERHAKLVEVADKLQAERADHAETRKALEYATVQCQREADSNSALRADLAKAEARVRELERVIEGSAADPKAPELATCEPLEELEWFCPHCGVLRVRLRCAADSYATNVIDEDGCCAFCGYTCCRMSEVRTLLSAHGLHIVGEADKRALDACALEGLDHDEWAEQAWNAELARRSET